MRRGSWKVRIEIAVPRRMRLVRCAQRRQHHRRIGHHAVFVEMMLGAEERVVAERLGQLALAHHLLVELGNGARAGAG